MDAICRFDALTVKLRTVTVGLIENSRPLKLKPCSQDFPGGIKKKHIQFYLSTGLKRAQSFGGFFFTSQVEPPAARKRTSWISCGRSVLKPFLKQNNHQTGFPPQI